MTIGVAFFDASSVGGGVESGLLASYLTGLRGAYSLMKLRSLYTGSAIRVRRSSDNTEQDIGFSGTALNTTALATFVGANDGFITKWYDQSGGSNDAVQATSGSQPKIVDAGTYTGEILFDGVDDVLATGNSGTPTAFSVHVAGRLRMGANTTVEALILQGTSVGMYTQQNSGQADNYILTVQADPTTGSAANYDDIPTDDATTHSVVIDRTQASVGTENVYYKNGAAQTSVTTSGTQATGSFTAATWKIGGDTGAFGRAAFKTVLIYETAQSAGTVGSISALIKPTAPTLGLDSYTTGAYGVYSLRKQITAYAGSAIRVRRSSDSTEQDIGFSSGLLDNTALLSFVGAGNGFIAKWYDQTGAGNYLTQATAANQPLIVESGVRSRGVKFSSTNCNLATVNNSGTPSAFSIFLKAHVETTSQAENILEQTANFNTNTGAIFYKNAALDFRCSLTQTSQTNRSQSGFLLGFDGQVVGIRLDRSAGTPATQAAMFSGGRLLTRNANNDAGTLPSGNFIAAKWWFGGRNGASTWTGDAETLVIYESAITDANFERISRALG